MFLYPQKKKDDLDGFYSVIIIGHEIQNLFFRNGFLNFLFDINEDDDYRLVLDAPENKEKDNKDNLLHRFYSKVQHLLVY